MNVYKVVGTGHRDGYDYVYRVAAENSDHATQLAEAEHGRNIARGVVNDFMFIASVRIEGNEH